MNQANPPPSPFRRDASVDRLNALSRGTAMEPLGIVFSEIGHDFVRGTMPVDERTRQPHTAQTTYPVPLILFDTHSRFGVLRGGGVLSNVAPTILTILGIEKPAEMTAESLLVTT